MSIQSRTCRSLEWDRLREFLAAEALTVNARKLCLEVETHERAAVIELLLDETSEALSLLNARSGLSQEGLPDLTETLHRLYAKGSLNARELLDVKRSLLLARTARSSLGLLETNTFPRLSSFVPRLHALEPLVEAIDAALDDMAQVKSEATPVLAKLRREAQRIDNRIRDELLRIIHSSTLSKALQEPIFTQRSGRYVLPVNASMRQTIPGIVHDSSASGLTVYVEPMAVVEQANDFRVKETEIEREIAKILADLSIAAAAKLEQIEESFNNLIELDFIMARARLAQKYNGTCPQISRDGNLVLLAAKHPLLILQDPSRASHVVPNDIYLSQEQCTLVITGPNTGGKTVYLKTAGLLSLMVRAGLLLPVAPGSKVVVFTNVYADIGDEQSIEQSLSTFSSHLSNIVEIIARAGSGSLILLDEIGVGTDPREGAALARSILETLSRSGAYTISTTHYGELKTLAYTQKGFLNASLDFDQETLSPTYRLRLGVPGSSKATTIAARLGLNAEVVARANALMQEDAHEVQDVIDQLEQKLRQTIEREEQARLATEEALELERISRRKLEDFERQQESIRQQYANRIEQEFSVARETVREIIAELQKQPSSQRALRVKKDMEVLRQELKWVSAVEQAHGNASVAISVGQRVKILTLNQIGVVEDLLGDKDKQQGLTASVRVGSLKVKVPLTDLEILSPAPASGQKAALKSDRPGRSGHRASLAATAGEYHAPVFVRGASNTLDLRGQRVDPALGELERFLDEAVMDRVSPVMVIHGHGTGAMKSMVRDYLRQSGYSSSFRPGEIHEGGDGVTVVDLT